MSDSYLAYQNPTTTDKKLDSESLSVGENTVERERVQIAGATATQIAPVDATAGLKVNLGADNDVTVASGGIASGAIASGAVASGAIASGALAAGSITSGAAVAGAFADGASVTLGAKTDAKSTATDGTSVTAMQVLKQISASVQAPPSQAVTFTGSSDVATQTTLSAINTKLVSGTDIGDVTINNSTGASAVNIQDGGNVITVDGTVAVTNAGITTIAGAVAGTEMQCDVLTMPTITVNSHAVTNAGTFAVQGTAVGTVADDATTPGAPVMIGGMAVETDGTDPTSVSAEADVAILRTDRNRRLLVNDRHPFSWTATLQHDTAQTDHELVAAPGANLSLYVTDVIVSNGATAGTVKIIEDTASAKTAKIDVMYLAINGGASISLKTPIRCTANKNLGFTSATVTTHTVTVMGYTAP